MRKNAQAINWGKIPYQCMEMPKKRFRKPYYKPYLLRPLPLIIIKGAGSE